LFSPETASGSGNRHRRSDAAADNFATDLTTRRRRRSVDNYDKQDGVDGDYIRRRSAANVDADTSVRHVVRPSENRKRPQRRPARTGKRKQPSTTRRPPYDDRPPTPSRRRKAEIAEALATGEAWQCHMETFWQRMPEGTFPPYVQTGRCAQQRCMAGLYECRPRRYATRVLRRLDDRCNPVPLVGDADGGGARGFEEAWVVEELHVVVGCECSKRRVSGWYDEAVALSEAKASGAAVGEAE
jgi:hypothetical protein